MLRARRRLLAPLLPPCLASLVLRARRRLLAPLLPPCLASLVLRRRLAVLQTFRRAPGWRAQGR